MEANKLLNMPDRESWRAWLQSHGAEVAEVWLLFTHAGAGPQGISYADALDEALCYGWVDSLIQNVDERSYARKFTPRRAGSRWSSANRRHVLRLIAEGRMTPAGLAKVTFPLDADSAEGDARRDQPLDPELEALLRSDEAAWAGFCGLPPSQRRLYVRFIMDARRPATRLRRLREALGRLQRGERLGIERPAAEDRAPSAAEGEGEMRGGEPLG
jgi:uncharacterized protein YdeI (YjbR/CyaY-like superfamily)